MLSKDWTKAIAAGASALGGITALLWLFWILTPKSGDPIDWIVLFRLSIAVALAFGVTAMILFALAPISSGDSVQLSTPADADVVLRSRMAPIVLGIGSAAIILLALGLFIEFGVMEQNQDPNIKGKIDTLLNGVFSSVLPVFATWVGTVIAFYFTNESFRQASQAARENMAGSNDRLRSIPVKSAMLPRALMVTPLNCRSVVD